MSRIFITGSSDGLGLLTAQKLIKEGHRVVLHARNDKRAEDAGNLVPDAEAVLTGDLSVIGETKELAQNVNALGSFDAIIHNAGILHVAANAKSRDGIPLLFAVNSLAPYILTALINRPERLIYLSSGLHRSGTVTEDRLESIVDGTNFPGYSDTKLHDLMLALALARKYPDMIVNAVDPGWVPTKMGGNGATDDLDKGYETQAWLAVSQDPDALKSGRLLYHKKEERFKPEAADEVLQEKLLSVCEKITHIPFK
ncbi:SDR family NAD(P)-dependent oxidoreductase [Saccharicrinis sp. FJH2]|uniref:SDR family NAD(P)-dependent oxidoreductase n=1 Tax=Saccharicrinis sp. FJH65 TaxID=3344659 RepID=UPI0035F2FB4A